MLFVGDDWAEDHHDVEVQDEAGRRLGKAKLAEGIAGRHCCIEPECAGEAQQSGGSPSWKGAEKGSNHSTVPMICRLWAAKWRQSDGVIAQCNSATTSTVDHFIPGIGVDRNSSGATARIGLTYYFYPNRSCTAATCQLDVGFISSANGGASWSTATQLAGPMTLSWIANTSQGRMVGDYISTSIRNGANAYPTIAVAFAPSGGTFNEAMYVPTGGLAVTGGARQATTRPVLAPSGAGRLANPRPGPGHTAR